MSNYHLQWKHLITMVAANKQSRDVIVDHNMIFYHRPNTNRDTVAFFFFLFFLPRCRSSTWAVLVAVCLVYLSYLWSIAKSKSGRSTGNSYREGQPIRWWQSVVHGLLSIQPSAMPIWWSNGAVEYFIYSTYLLSVECRLGVMWYR